MLVFNAFDDGLLRLPSEREGATIGKIAAK